MQKDRVRKEKGMKNREKGRKVKSKRGKRIG